MLAARAASNEDYAFQKLIRMQGKNDPPPTLTAQGAEFTAQVGIGVGTNL